MVASSTYSSSSSNRRAWGDESFVAAAYAGVAKRGKNARTHYRGRGRGRGSFQPEYLLLTHPGSRGRVVR